MCRLDVLSGCHFMGGVAANARSSPASASQDRCHKAQGQVGAHVFFLHPLDQSLVVDVQGFLKASIREV